MCVCGLTKKDTNKNDIINEKRELAFSRAAFSRAAFSRAAFSRAALSESKEEASRSKGAVWCVSSSERQQRKR